MKLSEELQARGFVYQFSTESLADIFDGPKRTVYLGIDPTADSIHVGNLVPFMALNHILNAGHKVIMLMGGGTALIGDPSFKESERTIVDASVIKEQCTRMEESIRRITTSDDVVFVNNLDWLSQLSAIEFLRDVGKHFTVNAMIKKESVARRFENEEGISFTEFSYSLLQGYDFYHLNTEKDCDVQIGGSDQWGNIISGVDYVRRVTGKEVYGMTIPLIVDKATGKKFGKSEGNAVWTDAEKTSPYAFYQFWLNTSDESVIDYLKLFTFVSLEEIANIEREFSADPGTREAQKRLAFEVTKFVHGENAAHMVSRASESLFGTIAISELSDEEKDILVHNAPLSKLTSDTLLVDALVTSQLASSKREARTFIESGAVQVNGNKVTDTEYTLSAAQDGNLAVLKRGKKNMSLVSF